MDVQKKKNCHKQRINKHKRREKESETRYGRKSKPVEENQKENNKVREKAREKRKNERE